MKKIAVVSETTVNMLLIIIVLIILLYFTGAYKIILSLFFKDTLCEASFIASSISKTMTLGLGNPTIEPECKVNKYTIVENYKDDVENQYVLQRDYPVTLPDQVLDTYLRVKNWNLNPNIKEELKFSYFEDYSKESFSNGETIDINSPTQEQKDYVRARYNMDKLFAEELTRCWDIVGQGELPLFDKWFTFIDCKEDEPGIQSCENLGDWVSVVSDGNLKQNSRFCVLCARIKFDTEVQNKFQESYYDSVARWMGNYPKRVGEKQSYYDYVYNLEKMSSYAEQVFPKFNTNTAQAIVFIRINEHKAIELLKGVIGAQKYDDADVYYFNTIKLIPYEDLPKECDYLVASEI